MSERLGSGRIMRPAIGWLLAFALGAAVGAFAAKKPGVGPALYAGKPAPEAAEALLGAAKVLAEKGSWENIAVGRVYYLSGKKPEGQAIFDAVTGGKKVDPGDWMRIGRVYYEAGEWDKARPAFDKVLQLKPDDEDWLAEVGAYYTLKGDRAKGEELFTRSFQREPNSLWNTLRAAAAYDKVLPPS
ncbi:MAG TPA: tetratricopeptide repeat protein [Dongiaceae bacterium]